MPKIVDRSIFINAAWNLHETGVVVLDNDVITRDQVLAVCQKVGISYPAWLTNDPTRRVGRGAYRLPKPSHDLKTKAVESDPAVEPSADPVVAAMAPAAVIPMPVHVSGTSLIPEKEVGYVPFGHFNDVRAVISSRQFYPIYITGLSGNGKTMMIEQVCAVEKRECVRVNITIDTDEDDLLGGFRLVNGQTVWQNGPVITAMERGAVLLLDEVDLGSNKLMCLQPILEGRPIYLKKINKVISPAPGFTVFATANTKGRGSDDGRFIGTNVMNEAFLERFSVTLEQEYPALRVETKILRNIIDDKAFVDKLVSWADVIRKSFKEGAVSDIISTRRLVHICKAYLIFNRDREKAVTLCLNRFDEDTKNSFMDLYKKLDETVSPATPDVTLASTEEVAF